MSLRWQSNPIKGQAKWPQEPDRKSGLLKVKISPASVINHLSNDQFMQLYHNYHYLRTAHDK